VSDSLVRRPGSGSVPGADPPARRVTIARRFTVWDAPEQVHEKLASLDWPPDPPLLGELAERYGDRESRKLYSSLWGVGMK
jgi:hypothetical protein